MLSETTDLTEDSTQERAIAALDLGSNSFHMVIAKQRHGELKILETHAEKVQLAAGMNTQGKISEEAEQRALACLERFEERIRYFNAADVQIVGTNALRVAKNRRAFILKAQKIIGFPIEVISGREEARLIYLGVAHSMADDQGRRLVIDIGGGSTELVIGERFETHLLESLHMGCVSYRDRYFSDPDTVHKADFDRAVLEASRELLNIKAAYKRLTWDSCVGSSGSIKAVFNALKATGHCPDEEITLDGLNVLRKAVLKVSSINELREFGVKQDRLSTFAAGLAILYAVFKVLKIQTMKFSSEALREGLLYDIVGRIEHEDVRHRTITSLQQRYHIDIAQSERVEETCLHAYFQVAKDWEIEEEENESMLRWASGLYELGNTISHTQHHKHGAYLIQHSDLPGFTELTQKRLAVLVRLHRRRIAEDVMNELEAEDARTIIRLVVLLRLAVILTANRIAKETRFTLNVRGDDHIVLNMGEDWISKHPLTIANLKAERSYLLSCDLILEIT